MQADQKRAQFFQPEGDHLTLLAVYEGWKRQNFNSQWCMANYIQVRSLRRAQDVRKQLLAIMDRYSLQLSSAGKDYVRISKAITSGYFFHTARKDAQDGYKSIVRLFPPACAVCEPADMTRDGWKPGVSSPGLFFFTPKKWTFRRTLAGPDVFSLTPRSWYSSCHLYCPLRLSSLCSGRLVSRSGIIQLTCLAPLLSCTTTQGHASAASA